MAARYALDNKEIIKGLVLWASYPDKDIPFTNITVLGLVGTNDGILNSERYETRKRIKNLEAQNKNGGGLL